MDVFRDLSNEYFIVNRDFIQAGTQGNLDYVTKGFRGTGVHGERILPGDQLVDLNGRFIGVSDRADHIIRIDTLNGWQEIVF